MESFRVLERSEHTISRKFFSEASLKVLYRLRSNGFSAYLVGGALRDIIRGRQPRDYDVVSDASHDDIRRLFRNSKVVGKRFPIVHTYFGDELIEISSLKREGDQTREEMIYADAKRRDFTVNALYYDIEEFRLFDPLNALADLEKGLIVCVGDPAERFQEDPIRMLRALKLKVTHGLHLPEDLQMAIRDQREHLRELGAGRKYEEITRVFLDEKVSTFLENFQDLGLSTYFWPVGCLLINEKGSDFFSHLRSSIPVTISRGSFSKECHTTLWMRLFFEAGVFNPNQNSADMAKHQFSEFIEPLGFPFRAPVVEALQHITGMTQMPSEYLPSAPIAQEVKKLLDYYVRLCDPGMKHQLRQFLAAEPQRKTKKIRHKAQEERHLAHKGESDAPVKSKTRRRRRRRRRTVDKTPSA